MQHRDDLDEFGGNEVHHDDGEGNWLISYADMMTLLWGFFVIISALSTPDPAKIEKLKESTSESMGGKYEKPYNEITDAITKVLKELNIDKDVQIETLADGIKVTAQSAKFFEPGQAILKEEAQDVMKKIGDVLKGQGKDFIVLIEGHTDDVPIKNAMFGSNWDLSTKRATAVVHIFEELGIDHTDLRPVGLADIQPVVKIEGLEGDALSEARSKNRRVVIRLQRKVQYADKKGVQKK